MERHMGKIFGTDGIRGVANTELTADMAFRLGMASVRALSKEKERPVFLIGRDTRISGDMLEGALSAGILSMGGDVISTGILPTPAVAHLVRHYRADAGAVISASHNPFEYNGIKFFNGDGFKLDDAIEDEIERAMSEGARVNGHISGARLGRRADACQDAAKAYVDFLKSTSPADMTGLKLALDCANGAACGVAEEVFTSFGAQVTLIGDKPDGLNINDGCGSTHPERLLAAVRETGAFMGLAFDGDADRLIASDEKGRVIDGDKIMYICAKMMKEKGSLRDGLVTATVMSNLGLSKALREIGCEVQHTGVGDRMVLERMIATGSVLGGEQSGHVIFLNHSTTGDGMLAGIQLIMATLHSGLKPSELADHVTIYPQVLRNAKIRNENKDGYMEDDAVRAEIESVEERMAGEGRVLIRPSGTEPLVRVMLEGRDIDAITRMADSLACVITEKLG
jgi:phosphoglucosamine mutase